MINCRRGHVWSCVKWNVGISVAFPANTRITTISATNHIGHDHIGYRRNRPQTTSATAYTISATMEINIGHRQ